MFIDTFSAFDEIKLAEFRIRYLSSEIDHTVIIESNLTFSGIEKKLLFKRWLENKKSLFPRVTVISVDLSAHQDSWSREFATREALTDYIYKEFPDTNYILSDLDEIPSLQQVKLMKGLRESVKFHTPTFYRRINWAVQDDYQKNWTIGLISNTSLAKLPNAGRNSDLPTLVSEQSGAHFSYLKYIDVGLPNKLESFAHTELNLDFLKTKSFNSYVDEYQIDHLGRFFSQRRGLLKFIDRDAYNEVQQDLASLHPELTAIRNTKKKRPSRLLASAVVTAMITHPRSAPQLTEFFILNKRTAGGCIRAFFLLFLSLIQTRVGKK